MWPADMGLSTGRWPVAVAGRSFVEDTALGSELLFVLVCSLIKSIFPLWPAETTTTYRAGGEAADGWVTPPLRRTEETGGRGRRRTWGC